MRSTQQRIDSIIDFKNFRGNYLSYSVNGVQSYLAVLKISGIDYESLSEDDIIVACNSFAKATQGIKLPHKYVFTTAKPDMQSQRIYVDYKLKKTKDRFIKHLLDRERQRYNYFEKYRNDRQDYMLVSGLDPGELNHSLGRYINGLKHITSVSVCNPIETESFLKRYLNMTTATLNSDTIMPRSLSLKDTYFVINDTTYVSCIVINAFPSYVCDFDLANLLCNRYADCTVTMDVEECNKLGTLKSIKNSIEEINGRASLKYQKQTDHLDNAADYQDMTALYTAISRGQEQIVSVTYRIYVKGVTLEAMQERLKDIVNELQEYNIQGFVRVNEMLDEFKGLILPSNYIATAFPLHDTYKRQFPFYDECLCDPNGIYLGESQSGGLVAIDFFRRCPGRESYDIMSFGLKGSGKTILFKSLIQSQIMQGNKVFAIDIEDEYSVLSKVLGGNSIRFSRNSTINPLQIRSAVISEIDDGETNFSCEISRIITFMHIYAPSLTGDASELLKDSLIELYNDFNIDENCNVAKLSPSEFPTFKDLRKVLERKLYKDDGVTFQEHYTLSDQEAYRELIRLTTALSGQAMFGSTTNVNYKDATFVVFNVKSLSEMDDNVFNAQLFNIISIMWSEVCKNVSHNKSLEHPYDRRRVVCLADEAHRFINANNPVVLSFFEKLLRRSRKYDAALWFATQSVLDVNPEGTDAGFNSLRTIFNLVQYKIILKQQTNCFNHLKATFSQLTDSEINSTAEFESGQMIILLGAGRCKIHCSAVIERGDLLYLGNSQDVQEIIAYIYHELYYEYEPEMVRQQLSYDAQHFKNVFAGEVLETIGLEKSVNPYIEQIINNAIDNLVSTLLHGGVV